MSIKERVQDAMKSAMKEKDHFRLECLRMAKGALLLKEKESAADLSEEVAVQAIRAEIKKRQQSIEVFIQVNRAEDAENAKLEIAILEEFLPTQLSAEQTEEKVRAYLAEHPELNHPGKLTGAMKKELGDAVDGKILNEVCKKVLGL
jgi:uncharacterized protein YqeY